MLKKISIIGLGLIGSSIARAVKKLKLAEHISAYNKTSSTAQKALAAGIVDSIDDTAYGASKNADIIILCTPTGTYKKITKEIAELISENTILTDAGSVKNKIIDEISSVLSAESMKYYVPGHPIAGSEKSGLDAGSDDLYEGKKIILTPTDITDKSAIERIKNFWEAINSEVIIMPPKAHDNAYALSSHIVHLISFAFIKSIANQKIVKTDSFKKFIRLAASSPIMWADIFIDNKDAILENINNFYSKDALKKITDKDIYHAIEKRIEMSDDNIPLHSVSENVVCDILPKIIACAAINSITDYNHVGGGFLGITENILSTADNFNEIIKNNQNDINEAIDAFYREVDKLNSLIKSDNLSSIIKYIESANAAYNLYYGQ